MNVQEPVDRESALERVLARRVAGRARAAPLRIAVAVAGAVAGLAAIPLAIVLPELGIPLLLVALRLLAVEFDWAARAYAWVIWRWHQVTHWFAQASTPARAATVLALVAIAVGLVWLLAHEFG